MEPCKLCVLIQGGFYHPLDTEPTALEGRSFEDIQTSELPEKQLLTIERHLTLHLRTKNPRWLLVHNMAGENLDRYPDEKDAAVLSKKVLLIGLNGKPSLRLLPAVPGSAPGQSQDLWLSPGAVVNLQPETPGLVVPVRVLAIPGPAES